MWMLWCSVAQATPEEENALLREAVEALQAENAALREESVQLRRALDERTTAFVEQMNALDSAREALTLADERTRLTLDQLAKAERLAEDFEMLYRLELRKQPPAWQPWVTVGAVALIGSSLIVLEVVED